MSELKKIKTDIGNDMYVKLSDIKAINQLYYEVEHEGKSYEQVEIVFSGGILFVPISMENLLRQIKPQTD